MRFVSFLRAAPIGLALLAACHRQPDEIAVEKAWVRLAPVPGRPAAAYLVIHGGAHAARLVAVDSPEAGASELHRSMASGPGGMMSMQRLDGLDIPANGEAAFAPGGNHVMLFGVGAGVKPGDTMPLSVRFTLGAPIAVTAKVVGAGDPVPY